MHETSGLWYFCINDILEMLECKREKPLSRFLTVTFSFRYKDGIGDKAIKPSN